MIAYGYIRLDDDNEQNITQWHDKITAHCTAHGHTLGEIYVDRDTPTDAIDRKGFGVLLDSLMAHAEARIVVPSLDHLSSAPAVRTALLAKIGHAGGRVITLRNSERRGGYCA